MGVSLKISAYSKNRSNEFSRINITKWDYNYSNDWDYHFWTIYGYDYIAYQSLLIYDQIYGLKGRQIRSVSGEGEKPTSARILGFAWDSEFNLAMINHYNWSNGSPGGSTVTHKCYVDTYEKPIRRYGFEESIDCTEDLLDQDIKINFRVETNEVMDLEYSYGEIIIDASEGVKDFFDTYSFYSTEANREYLFGVELFKDGISETWMGFKRKDFLYDEIEQNYKIKCYDWVKIQLEEIGGNNLPYLSGTNVPISNWLLTCFENFVSEDPQIELSGMSDIISAVDYRSFYTGTFDPQGNPNPDGYWMSVNESMKVDDFLIEVQKHFAAFIYYGKNRKLYLTSRNYTSGEIVIDDLIMEDTFEKVIFNRTFNAIILNVENWTVIGGDGGVTVQYNGWALVEFTVSGEVIAYSYVPADEATTKNRTDILDLRQKLTVARYTPAIFEMRTAEQRYEDYKELLADLIEYKCTVNSLDINLFTKVRYNNDVYNVLSVTKDYINETSELEIRRMPII